MVRRRARTAKSATTAGGISSASGELHLTGAVVNGHLRDDQYFASPKRKDCKIDNGQVDPTALVGAVPMQPTTFEDEPEEGAGAKSPSPGKTRGERGGIAGRTIGVPLATRSQTRTIENFFKANTAAKNAKLKEADSGQIASNTIIALPTMGAHDCASPPAAEELHNGHSPPAAPPLTLHRRSASHMQPDFIFDLSEDTNDTDNTELSDEAVSGASNAIDFETHRSPLRDSHGSSRSSTTDNIFLQEPVLTLNVDKSPNQASSIKINRSLEIEPIFSSPPSSLTAATLNGRFNQIVSLNGMSPVKRESFGYETQARANAHYSLQEEHHHDTSSCDSGVVFISSLDNNNSPLAQVVAQLSRQRKPATPHRIVCPSPIKSMAPRVVSPGGATVGNSPSPRKLVASKGDLLSPRKSQRHLATVASKTRRRLNQHKEQAPYPPTTTLTATAVVKMENGHNLDDDEVILEAEVNAAADEDDLEFENVEEAESATGYCGGAANGLPAAAAAAKSVLNSAKHPSAQQNTTNNNQDHHINTAKGGGHHKSKATDSVATKPQPKMKQHFQAPQPLTSSTTNSNNNGNRELTDFFPVRRSVRKTKTAVKEEMMRNLEQAVLEERAEGLKVAYFDGKGRGIVSDRRFQRGEFVVEYVGDLISMTEAAEREKRYALDENAGCYMYYFKHNTQQYCIDATHDTGKLGRLVNHSRTGNLITKVVVVKQRPHLILIAKDDIEAGEELTYDYGDRSKESLLHHPWLAF